MIINKEKTIKILEKFRQNNPEPKTELEYRNKFTLLVAIVLSAQATDVSVNKATQTLFLKYDTPEKLLNLGEEGLKQYIKTIGLYNSKAKNVIRLCAILIEKYGGQIPRDRDELQALPGVGRKTANVFLNCAYGDLTIGVDTHVERVSNRIGLISAKNPLQTELKLERKIPKEYKKNVHHWLILHGRYVCKARKPLCHNCLIYDLCGFKSKQDFHSVT